MSAEYLEDKEFASDQDPVELLPTLTKEIQDSLESTIKNTNSKLRELIKNGYYNRVSITFRCQVYEAILFFEATMEDLSVLSAVGRRTLFCYMEEFNQIARTATSLNTSLRFSWKTDSYPDDYSSECFLVLSKVYRELANMFESLEKLEDISGLLENK
ncbi:MULTISPECIES: hypothetical protein [unclassified Jeotgalibaca]|uniref:hypothetical protein n=1 Tax=unclassified Jeotgalibaca TaxID=2621505 RepID=UPI003FCF3604